MPVMDFKLFAISKKDDKSIASGFDHAERTGDNTFSIFFIDGTHVDLRIPLPEDGVAIVDVKIDENSHLICTMSDGTKIDAGEFENNAVLSEDLKATVEIGTVSSGKIYPKNTKLEKIIRDILIKEEAPTVALTLNPTKVLYDIVSETLSTIGMIANVTQKTYPPTKVTYSINNVVVNEKNITAGGSYGYSHNFASPVNTEQIIKVTVTDGKMSSSATKTIKFVGKSYYGICDSDIGTPTEAQIKALANNELKDVKALTYSGITTDFGKVCYAYPKDFGALTSIKDPVNNYNYTDSFSRSTVVIDGIDYFVYTQTEPSGADDVKLTFA
jgi:ribosomal protein L30E